MLSDEELIQQIRHRLHSELEEMYPADRVIHVWEEVEQSAPSSARPRPGAHRQRPAIRTVFGLAGAVAAVAIVLVAALALLGRHQQSPIRATGSQEQPLLRILGVLRRPQTKADLPPALRQALVQGSRGTLAGAPGSPDLPGVRLATVTPEGEQVFLVPIKPPTAADISKLPPGLRAALRLDLVREIRQGGTLRIALMSNGRFQGQFGGGITAQTIVRGPAGFLSGARGLGNNVSELVEIVPDRVAKVTLLVPVAPQNGPTRVVKVTRQVHNNVVVVHVPEAPDEQRHATIWYGPAGKVLKRFGHPAHLPAPHAATCRPSRRFLCGRPPRSITSVLGSLSRRPSPGQRLSQDFLGPLVWQGSGAYVRYARSGTANGVPYYLIPMSDSGGNGCAGQPGVQVILEYAGDEAHSCLSMSQIHHHIEPGTLQAGSIVTPLVVPDNVASVTANYRAKHRTGHVPHQIITQQANDNIVIFKASGEWNPPLLTYRSASGATLWTHQAH